MGRTGNLRRRARRGSSLMEFSFVALLLFMILLTMFELDRMVLVSTAIADSARAGVRYAIVHGSNNSTTVGKIQNVVKGFASSGVLDPTRLTITSTYVNTMAPGTKVDVTVKYVYDPFTRYFPLGFTLGSTSEGVITY